MSLRDTEVQRGSVPSDQSLGYCQTSLRDERTSWPTVCRNTRVLTTQSLTLCQLLDELKPDPAGSYKRLITYVTDRPGHDRRYAIDARKIERELGWRPAETFATGIRKTVEWYLANQAWVHNVQSGAYRDWLAKNYADR